MSVLDSWHVSKGVVVAGLLDEALANMCRICGPVLLGPKEMGWTADGENLVFGVVVFDDPEAR